MQKVDFIVIGGGLSGLVAIYEMTKAGKKVLLLDQESEQNLGGQAYWSFGGLFFVDSPQQRRWGIKDSFELAWQDWLGAAGFDRPEDNWPRQWAEAYVKFAATEKYSYVTHLGVKFLLLPGWAERGDGTASGHGNSVPRFHVAWGTGTGLVKPFVEKALWARRQGLLEMKFRRRVTEIFSDGDQVKGVKGDILSPATEPRGKATNREIIGQFEYAAENILVTSGGIGANENLVRRNWPVERLGNPPEHMITGVPAYVDGKMIAIAEQAGASVINRDRMWHYTEGIKNFDPIWPNHAIRVLPGPSSLWFDAEGNRFNAPYLPGFDTLGTLAHILHTGHDYSWFILNRKIIRKEFALSGSEQNPDITNGSFLQVLKRIFGTNPTTPVQNFIDKGEDFVTADNLEELVQKMNNLAHSNLLKYEKIKKQIEDRDREIDNPFCKDTQITYIRSHRKYIGDRLMRVASPHKILDKQYGPLIAVRLNILTRKTLGGLETNLNGQVLKPDGEILQGLYAAGEVSGFGGGGMHGYRSLEGTFLGGCIFSGMRAGKYLGGL